MASDSQITADHARTHCVKIERIKGALVGIVGTPLWNTFVRGYSEPLEDLASVEAFALAWVLHARFLATAFEDGMPNGCLLVAATSAELFQVCNDGAVIPIPDGDPIAIGSGAPFAMGALYCGASVRVAVAAAIVLDPFCGGAVRDEQVSKPG